MNGYNRVLALLVVLGAVVVAKPETWPWTRWWDSLSGYGTKALGPARKRPRDRSTPPIPSAVPEGRAIPDDHILNPDAPTRPDRP